MLKIQKTIAQKILIEFCHNYNTRNLQGVMDLFTKNPNLWGTGADEYRAGREAIEEQLKRDWSQSEKSEINIGYFIRTDPDSSWAASVNNATIVANGQEHNFSDLRGSISIEQEDGIWKIAHMHCSFPDYRNGENNSFPIKV
jgi:ketosteroid isomerase-like protein